MTITTTKGEGRRKISLLMDRYRFPHVATVFVNVFVVFNYGTYERKNFFGLLLLSILHIPLQRRLPFISFSLFGSRDENLSFLPLLLDEIDRSS